MSALFIAGVLCDMQKDKDFLTYKSNKSKAQQKCELVPLSRTEY